MNVLYFVQNDETLEQLNLALGLRWPDIESIVASNANMGLRAIEDMQPDLVILCDDLPGMSITSAIREIRLFSDVPIIVATDNQDEMSVVRALEAGADDYIRFPCDLMEIMARTVALLRRVGITNQRSPDDPIHVGNLVINPANFEAYMDSDALPLTPTEFKLLYLLAKNRHVTLSREFILRDIWADDIEAGKCLKKYIQRLRSKLSDDARNPRWIKTIHGFGYRFTPPSSESGTGTAKEPVSI